MSYLVFSLLFLLPFLVAPFGVSPFEIPKVIVAEVLMAILLLTTILLSPQLLLSFPPASRGERKRESIKIILPFLGLFLLTVIHLLFFSTETTLFGNQFRLQGVFLLWNLLIFAVISAQVKLPKLPDWIWPGPILLLLLSTLFITGSFGRAVGTLGEPNALAATALFFGPFAFWGRFKWIRLLSLMGAGLVIFLSDSRSGLIAFVIQIVFLLLLRRFSLKSAFLISLILIAGSLILPFAEGGGWYENRAEIWHTALVSGSLSPIFGHGFGNITPALNSSSKILNNNIQYQLVDSAHNIFLDFWVQGGFWGVLCLVLLTFGAVKGLVKKHAKLELTAFLAVFTMLLFNPASVVTLLTFFWLIGQGFVKKSLG